MIVVRFQRLESGKGTVGTIDEPGLPPVNLPAYQSAEAAGMDLHAAQEVTIPAGLMRRVSTGFNVKIPAGFEGQVRSRSGMAFKHLCVVLNAPGTIDSDYTGELFVMLVNHGAGALTIKRNDRVAQLVVSPVVRAVVKEVEVMPTTERGHGGFGSTGGMPPLLGAVKNAAARAQEEEVPHYLHSLMGAGRHAGERIPIVEHEAIPEGCALLCSPGREPVLVRVERLRPFLTAERLAEIEQSAAAHYRDHWEPFMKRFRAMPDGEQIALIEEIKTKTDSRLKLPENQRLVADAMENPHRGCSIGQKGK